MLYKKGRKKIVLNFQEVTYIDVSGIGELIGAFSLVRESGGLLKLLCLTIRIKDLLEITELYTVFEVFENEEEAIASFD